MTDGRGADSTDGPVIFFFFFFKDKQTDGTQKSQREHFSLNPHTVFCIFVFIRRMRDEYNEPLIPVCY